MKDITPEIEAIASGYEYHKPPDFLVRLGELLAQLNQWLISFLQSLRINVPGALDSRSVSGVMQMTIFIAGACGIVIVFWLMWRRASANGENKNNTRRGASAVEEILDASGLKMEAGKLAKRGEFRQACRSLYLALLQCLHEGGIAAFSPAKTNYEYRYLLSNHPRLKQNLIAMADRVEPIWFGGTDAILDDYNACLSILSSVENEIARSNNRT